MTSDIVKARVLRALEAAYGLDEAEKLWSALQGSEVEVLVERMLLARFGTDRVNSEEALDAFVEPRWEAFRNRAAAYIKWRDRQRKIDEFRSAAPVAIKPD